MSTTLTVTDTDWITPVVRRIHFRSDDLSAFADSSFTDRYVKIVFRKPGVVYPEPLNVRELRGVLPPEDMPDVRTYTALFPDVAAGTLAIDFVIHGDEGVAGPWAAAAQPGDTLLVNGPGGAYRPDPTADWHLLAGDESALPAITAAMDVTPGERCCSHGHPGRRHRSRTRNRPSCRLAGDLRLPLGGRGRCPADRDPEPRVAKRTPARVCSRRSAGGHARGASVPAHRARTGSISAVHLGLLAPREQRGRISPMEVTTRSGGSRRPRPETRRLTRSQMSPRDGSVRREVPSG